MAEIYSQKNHNSPPPNFEELVYSSDKLFRLATYAYKRSDECEWALDALSVLICMQNKSTIFTKHSEKAFYAANNIRNQPGTVSYCLYAITKIMNRESIKSTSLHGFLLNKEEGYITGVEPIRSAQCSNALKTYLEMEAEENALGEGKTFTPTSDFKDEIEKLAKDIVACIKKTKAFSNALDGDAGERLLKPQESLAALLTSVVTYTRIITTEIAGENQDCGWFYSGTGAVFEDSLCTQIYFELIDSGIAPQLLEKSLPSANPNIKIILNSDTNLENLQNTISCLNHSIEDMGAYVDNAFSYAAKVEMQSTFDDLAEIIYLTEDRDFSVRPAKAINLVYKLYKESDDFVILKSPGLADGELLSAECEDVCLYGLLVHGDQVCYSNAPLLPLTDNELAQAAQNARDKMTRLLSSIWEEIPAVFSALPAFPATDIIVHDNGYYVILPEGCDLNFPLPPDTQLVRTDYKTLFSGYTVPEVDSERNILIVPYDETEKPKEELPHENNAALRLKFHREFPTVNDLIRELCRNHGVEHIESRGAGSHSMLARNGIFWTLSAFKRREDNNLSFKDGMKILKALAIPLEDILS